MLTSDRNAVANRAGSEGAEKVEQYRKDRECWVNFCLFPDVIEPCRMPSLFPIPTHVFKRQTITTLSLGNLEGGYNIRCLWSPDSGGFGAGGQPQALVYRKLNTAAPAYQVFDTSNDDSVAIGSAASAGEYTAVATIGLPAVSNEVAHGGIRLIGAFIEFEYVGTAENHSGTIEVGLHPHSRDDNVSSQAVHFASDSEIIQLPFYRRYKPADGARCIWFPIDASAFHFNPVGTGISATQTAPVKPVVIQWCININGLQINQGIRAHICNVYESIPDESTRDLFLPMMSPPQNLEASKTVLNQMVQQGVATTPAKSASNWSNVYQGIKSLANGLINNSGVIMDAVNIGKSFLSGAGSLGTLARGF